MGKRQEITDSPLYALLMEAVPENENREKTIVKLAEVLGISRWAIYKWIKKERIQPERVSQIVDISEGRVTLADFERYVYNT